MMKSRLAGKIKSKNPLSGILVPSDQKLFVTLVVELCVSRSSRKLTEMDSVRGTKIPFGVVIANPVAGGIFVSWSAVAVQR